VILNGIDKIAISTADIEYLTALTKAALGTIGNIFMLYIPVLLGYTLPIACFVAVILTFSRFSADNEIMAMRASGIHLWKLLAPLLIIGIIISLFALILYERIIPYAHYEQHKMLKSLGTDNPTALLEAGTFIHAFEGHILFIHKIEDNKMYNVTIYQPQKNGPTRTIIAKEGEFTPIPGQDKIKLKLINGTSDEPSFDNPDNFYKLNFDQFWMELDTAKNKKIINKKPKDMTLKELTAEKEHLERLFIETGKIRTEYWRKITWSFSPFFFIMLGFPLAVITRRREKSTNIVLAILFAALYYLISLGCESIAVREVVDPLIIMWVPNFLAAVVAIYLNFKCVY